MIPFEILFPHMWRVTAAEREMHDLGLLWQMIESSAAISCPNEVRTILPTLIQMRERFDHLRVRLVQALVDETLAEVADDMGMKAQCVADILVRNLYERTADIGFLATDPSLRRFCAAAPGDREALRPAMISWMNDYVSKYSVYEDIVVLSPGGSVLVRLNDSGSTVQEDAALASAAIATSGYIESYATRELFPNGAALIYASRVTSERDAVLGVLVLRFRLADEMARIFADVCKEPQRYAMMLVDTDDRLVSSSDPEEAGLGRRVASGDASGIELVQHRGQEYLSVTRRAQTYQGYSGPGWRARVMVPLFTAFRHDAGRSDTISLDNEELGALQLEADGINRNLRRVVWNGSLIQHDGDEGRLKAVLNQVSHAGFKTSERVRRAVDDLHRTSLARACRTATDIGRLAMDILDRNLYERANDCRWWALSPVIRRALASDSAVADASLAPALAHLNQLYSVYRRIVVFDANGRIVALSNDREGSSHLGSQVCTDWLQRVRGLRTSQVYGASDYVPDTLSDGEPAYTFVSAVFDRDGTCLGGVALVFETVRELSQILKDVLGDRAGFATFVDSANQVIASSDPAHAIGDVLDVDVSRPVTIVNDTYFAVSRSEGNGYREFKNQDGYENGIRAYVGLRLGKVERRGTGLMEVATWAQPVHSGLDRIDLAIFHVGASRYALPSDLVIGAVVPARVLQAPGLGPYHKGIANFRIGERELALPVICGRRLFHVDYPARITDGVAIILRQTAHGEPSVALWIDDVLSVEEVESASVQNLASQTGISGGFVLAMFEIGQDASRAMIQLVDANRILQVAGVRSAPVGADAEFPGSAQDILPATAAIAG